MDWANERVKSLLNKMDILNISLQSRRLTQRKDFNTTHWRHEFFDNAWAILSLCNQTTFIVTSYIQHTFSSRIAFTWSHTCLVYILGITLYLRSTLWSNAVSSFNIFHLAFNYPSSTPFSDTIESHLYMSYPIFNHFALPLG